MNQIHILLVEDNEGDILLTTEALEEGKIVNKISVVKDGKAAIDFLEKEKGYEKETLPDLILLDVNLPKKNGHEVLEYIKKSKKFKMIPVIILTTSSSEKDIIMAYKNYANCFITKPVEIGDFLQVVSSIENFWISIVHLPGKLKTNDHG
ncbi:MAG: response regulator [Bacteroidota bacterium]|nr:response regulator [Bacteroidota bacterium]